MCVKCQNLVFGLVDITINLTNMKRWLKIINFELTSSQGLTDVMVPVCPIESQCRVNTDERANQQ